MARQKLIWSKNKKSVTEIYIKVKRVQKPRGVVKAHTKFVRDLISCMRCSVRKEKRQKMLCLYVPEERREGFYIYEV